MDILEGTRNGVTEISGEQHTIVVEERLLRIGRYREKWFGLVTSHAPMKMTLANFTSTITSLFASESDCKPVNLLHLTDLCPETLIRLNAVSDDRQ